MLKNTIAIIGRPNVGKSTLFNRLAGRRISIVHEEPGVTRDRVETKLQWEKFPLHLIDTGGIDTETKNPILEQVLAQVDEAVKEATLVLFVVDARDGLIHIDTDIASRIRKSGKKTILVVNKVDNTKVESEIYDFHKLGIKTMVPISATHGIGISDLMDIIEKHLIETLDADETSIRVTVIGKPNVGKSTLINRLLGENRLIVDSEPGTTRDAVDVKIKIKDRLFTFVDTAGMRRRNQVRQGVEIFSVIRTLKSLRRSDLAILVLDVSEGVMAQDIRILDEIRKGHKSCVVALNKWDKVEKIKEKDFTKMLLERWKFLDIYPIIYFSALTGFNIEVLINRAVEVYEEAHREISQDDLDDFLTKLLARYTAPSEGGHIARFYAIYQSGIYPPQFNIHLNQPGLVKDSYHQFMTREFRKRFGFKGVQVQFKYLKGKGR